ncbi:MAG: S-methyl-5-thioribose-1-phosphate isomerase [Burkholderiaceae bacterium]|nr:S-methyl-5-thioribose-1-phosphate isomerase [Burkholderiaceae bacterium]
MTPPRTLWLDDRSRVMTLDQTRLPFEQVSIELDSLESCRHAIRAMQVRGAPLIGAVGAYGLAFGLRRDASDDALRQDFAELLASRPTAVNLRWALQRVADRVRPLPPGERSAAAWHEAGVICEQDVACNRAIGSHLAALLREQALRRGGDPTRALDVLTHCNAGRLATIAYGTALSPFYLLAEIGVPVHVWVDETRPRNQGASLTAWELGQAGVPHTVIADNAGGLLMMQGRVDAVIVGCDRVAANGDVANKVGTYLKALAAHAHGVPFYVACPSSTIDRDANDAAAIEIEARDGRELSHVSGRLPDGTTAQVQVIPDGSAAYNPAFDLTPAALVTALVTERGVIPATRGAIAALFAEH